jgi:hypothetical protein
MGQSLLFWETAAHHFVSLANVLLSMLPIVYMFTEVRPHELCPGVLGTHGKELGFLEG